MGGGRSVRKLHALRMAAVIKANRAYRPTGFGANVLAGRIVHGCFVWSFFFLVVLRWRSRVSWVLAAHSACDLQQESNERIQKRERVHGPVFMYYPDY